MSEPDVTACIPAYRSGDFIGATLESLRRQTYRNFRALISIDGPDEACEAVCREVARSDPRFEVIVQPRRLGWLENINGLFDRVDTPFYFLLPHDDQIDETYVETLRAEALAHPEAVNVYCDMRRYGERRDDVPSIDGLDGPLFARLKTMLGSPFASVPWRGLIRRSLAGDLRQRPNAMDDYGSHALWLLELLCIAPFRRAPVTLYRQWVREDERSVTYGWRSWSRDRHYRASAEHTLQTIERLSAVQGLEPDERQALILMLLLRLLGHGEAAAPFSGSESPGVDGRLVRAAELLARVHGAPYLGPDTARRLQAEPELQPLMAKLRLADAAAALSHGRLNEAEVAIDAALALDPQSGGSHLRRAMLLRRRGKLQGALEAIGQARRLMPSDLKVQLELGNILSRCGDHQGAVAAARAAVDLDPASATAHYHLSLFLDRDGQRSAALSAAERAVRADPEHQKIRDHLQRLLDASA